MHYFYATNTPLVTIITTGVLVEALGFEPKTSRVKVYCATVTLRLIGACGKTRTCMLFLHQILSLACLPFHHTGMVLSVGNDPTFLALQASTLTISVKTAFGNATGIRTRDTSLKGK